MWEYCKVYYDEGETFVLPPLRIVQLVADDLKTRLSENAVSLKGLKVEKEHRIALKGAPLIDVLDALGNDGWELTTEVWLSTKFASMTLRRPRFPQIPDGPD